MGILAFFFFNLCFFCSSKDRLASNASSLSRLCFWSAGAFASAR